MIYKAIMFTLMFFISIFQGGNNVEHNYTVETENYRELCPSFYEEIEINLEPEIECAEEIDKEYYTKLVNSITNQLPKEWIEQFKKDDWRIVITDEDLNKKYFQDRYFCVYGATVYMENTIYLTPYPNMIKSSLIHEFGHYLDYSWGELSRNELKPMLTKSIEDYNNNFSFKVENESELYAESLQSYYKRKKSLQNTCPELYNYWDNLCNQ